MNLVVKMLAFFGTIVVIVGGIVTLSGSVLPWAHAILFDTVHISLPGFFFVLGSVAGLCGVAALCLTRHPVLCLLLGAGILIDTTLAVRQIPFAVRGGLLDAQKGFFPINEVLDKLDLDTVMVGNYGAKDSDYIGEGVQRTAIGGLLIFLGALITVPQDPWIRAGTRKFFKESCESCGAKWAIGRDVLYCPKCAEPTQRAYSVCRSCSNPVLPQDKFCVKCGYPREG